MSAKAAVFGTIAWAAGYLVSAAALKGNPIGDWIEGALLAGWTVFVSLAARSVRRRSTDETGAR
jgi:hypothetical protein